MATEMHDIPDIHIYIASENIYKRAIVAIAPSFDEKRLGAATKSSVVIRIRQREIARTIMPKIYVKAPIISFNYRCVGRAHVYVREGTYGLRESRMHAVLAGYRGLDSDES